MAKLGFQSNFTFYSCPKKVQITGVTYSLVNGFNSAQLNAHIGLYRCLILIGRDGHLSILSNSKDNYFGISIILGQDCSRYCCCTRLSPLASLFLCFSLLPLGFPCWAYSMPQAQNPQLLFLGSPKLCLGEGKNDPHS